MKPDNLDIKLGELREMAQVLFLKEVPDYERLVEISKVCPQFIGYPERKHSKDRRETRQGGSFAMVSSGWPDFDLNRDNSRSYLKKVK